jgi:hypothetical protein
VEPPLTRGCKKRKRNGSDDAAVNRTAVSQGENKTHHPASEHCLRGNGPLTATANTYPISPGSVQAQQTTFFGISVLEQAEGNGRVDRLRFDTEEHPPLPLADLG